MVFKRTIFSKILSNGLKADFAVARVEESCIAVLYICGRHILGPALPQLLTPQKGEITHWMGNHPSVGLSQDEAEKIIREVNLENSVLQHRKRENDAS